MSQPIVRIERAFYYVLLTIQDAFNVILLIAIYLLITFDILVMRPGVNASHFNRDAPASELHKPKVESLNLSEVQTWF